MSRQVKPGEIIYDQFPIWNDDGYTKKSGETSFISRVWKDAEVSVIAPVITEIGTSGEYRVTLTPDAAGFWFLEVTILYNQQVWFGEYQAVTGDIEDIYDIIRRVLGLSQENIFIDNTIYDNDSQLVAARVRIFDSKAHCLLATDGGGEAEGLIASYTTTSVWDFVNQFKYYRQVRDA